MQYRSDYRSPARRPSRRGHVAVTLLVGVVLVAVLAVGLKVYDNHKNSALAKTASTAVTKTASNAAPATAKAAAVNECANNTLSQLVLVSISKQHLWACSGSTAIYDSAVITGMELYPADLTPTGTYHIYGRQTDQTLTGHDSTGSWSDPVSYWMPFLDNQYGTYGFHDATWRPAGSFGNINIDAPYTATEHGSHGCVELPLATAKWLYEWASVGTTVTIES